MLVHAIRRQSRSIIFCGKNTNCIKENKIESTYQTVAYSGSTIFVVLCQNELQCDASNQITYAK
jgi:hypothetical protein